MKVMKQMQGELLALTRRKGRSNPGVNTDGEPQNSGSERPARSVDRKLICFTVKRRATSEGNARK
jgi:ribosomal protein L44E